jgi:hypothetical protein
MLAPWAEQFPHALAGKIQAAHSVPAGTRLAITGH